MKHVSVLPNILTLANAGCGLLAISKAIDALASGDPARFASLLEMSCWLILIATVLDGLDGRIARMTDSFSDFGAQLDSFADAITFGVAPAMVAKVLLERHALVHPRVHFLAAAAFALMAVLRLARFNLESDHDEESHRGFRGLPSPAAAGTIVAMILMFLSLGGGIEVAGGEATPVGKGVQYLPGWLREGLANSLLPALLLALPAIGLLMVSRIPYRHMATYFGGQRTRFQVLVKVVFIAGGLYLAPVPILLATGLFYIATGLITHLRKGSVPKT
jgi:CDP-diacylglycerol--serine O-phosphatidyltransferase